MRQKPNTYHARRLREKNKKKQKTAKQPWKKVKKTKTKNIRLKKTINKKEKTREQKHIQPQQEQKQNAHTCFFAVAPPHLIERYTERQRHQAVRQHHPFHRPVEPRPKLQMLQGRRPGRGCHIMVSVHQNLDNRAGPLQPRLYHRSQHRHAGAGAEVVHELVRHALSDAKRPEDPRSAGVAEVQANLGELRGPCESGHRCEH